METMKKNVRLSRWFLIFVISLLVSFSGSAGAATLADQCATVLGKVTACLTFVQGKAATPTKDCCTAVTEIRTSKPVCLCYFIQQTHNGSAEAKSMGIQEAKLLQLPSACKLANATVSDCPKLLNIPASSPDYKIFTNASTTAASTSPSTGSSSATKLNDSSNAVKCVTGLASTKAIAVIVFAFMFHTGW